MVLVYKINMREKFLINFMEALKNFFKKCFIADFFKQILIFDFFLILKVLAKNHP